MTRAERRLQAEKRKRRLRRFIKDTLDRDKMGLNYWFYPRWDGPRYENHEEISKLYRYYMRDEGRRIRPDGSSYCCDCGWCLNNKFVQTRKEKARIDCDFQAYLEGQYELQEEER